MDLCQLPQRIQYGSILLGLALLPACTHHKDYVCRRVTLEIPKHNSPTAHHREPPPVTVWVHGTYLIRTSLFHSHFGGMESCKQIHELDKKHHLHLVAKALHHAAPHQHPLETLYLFGWSGRLNASEREKAAQVLNHELEKLSFNYHETYGCKPHITVITHSHGGNVALNLANYTSPNAVPINRLILLACPVQKRTMDYIKSPRFQSVYTFHSSLDWVQIIAPQIICTLPTDDQGKTTCSYKIPPFSQRYFPDAPHIAQIKIKLNGRAITHDEFVNKKFLNVLPNIINEVDLWHKNSPPEYNKRRLLCVSTVQAASLKYDINAMTSQLSLAHA